MGQRDWAYYIGRPKTAVCSHSHTVSTVTAGLRRIVCEACGRVSISYDGNGASWPQTPGAELVAPHAEPMVETVPAPRHHRCATCGGVAVFLTPAGIACSSHAWEAASQQVSLEGDFWIPRLIDLQESRRLMDDLESGEGPTIDLTSPEFDE